jgi:two-component system invasion response regulator UvrY
MDALAKSARVLAVDDQRAFRVVVRELVDRTNELVLVAETDCGERAVALARELEPDIVLMDIRMPGSGGIAAANAIKEWNPSTVVVLVSTTRPDDLPPEVDGCLADEVLWKTDLRPRLLDEIWERHRGQRANTARV